MRHALTSAALCLATCSVASSQELPCAADSLVLPGDANRDLIFDSNDLLLVSTHGKYQNGTAANWEEGDWNGDGIFDEADLVLATATGHFEAGPYAIHVDGQTPSPRGGAPAVWLMDASPRPTMMLFGGMNPITADTYLFDPQEGWREVTSAAGPGARCHHTLVNDGLGNAVMFGGFSQRGRFNDTQRFDGKTQQWIEVPTHGDIPAKRCLQAAAWIPTSNEMLIYGGIDGSGGFAEDFFLDTSLLNLETGEWTRVDDDSPPGARAGAIAFYSTADRAVYLWGGLQVRGALSDPDLLKNFFVGYLNELWRFDPENRTWSVVETSGITPLGREDPTYFWDDVTNRLYVFHGFNKTFPLGSRLLGDAHVLDFSTRRWERLPQGGQGPPKRWRGSVTVDPLNGVALGCRRYGWLFGGWDAEGERDDTWRFDLQSLRWQRVCANDPK